MKGLEGFDKGMSTDLRACEPTTVQRERVCV